MRPYHPRNLTDQPYASWRVIVLAWVGKFLGIHFHICGAPFGSSKSAYVLRGEQAGIRPKRKQNFQL